MKLLLAVTAVAALAQSAAAASCAIATLSKLLLNQYIDQCSDDSGYGFATGVKPTETEVAGMCASDACHSLLADVEAMNLTECTLPIGDKISLFADLIDYVSDQCNADTPSPTTATPEPTTATPTPAPTTAIASCTSAQLRYLLTSTYQAQCVKDTGYSFISPTTPTEANVAAMCASESCVNLFAYVSSMVTTDCRIPVGGKILLLADLVDYVTDQCEADTPAPTTAAPEPTTAAPTPEPTTAPTPTPTAAIASCTSAQLRYLLTSTYQAQCVADTGYSFTAPTSPTDANVAAMCASESCVNLFDYVASMVTTDCRIPVGGKILLLADLVDYVSDQCSGPTTPSTTTPATEAPSTPVPTTETPTTPSPTTATPVATCKTSVLSALLTNQYIDQCGDDSGYSFTSGKQPDAEEVAGMCASTACANLLADVEALGLSECILPIGDKIYLFRDLVDYVSDQCSGPTTPSTTTPATEAPSTPVPTTETPTTPSPTTATPVATCKTSVLSALLTNQYIDQCGDDSGYSFTSGKQPDAEEVAGMCASTACANLLADVEALGLSECILPIGDKIYLFRDLVDYVSDQCSDPTTPSTTTPATEAPSTPVPTTETPETETPGTESPGTELPVTTTPSPGTESPATPTPGTETPGTEPPTTGSPTTNTPTTETPEPTSPTHDAC